MMELCEGCARLKASGGRSDVPNHLTRVTALEDRHAYFHYQCEGCGAEWDWLRGSGWQLQGLAPEPMMSRLLAAARLRIGTAKR